MRKTFDDYNETCEMIDGYVAIHPHNLGLLMLRGISSTGNFGWANVSSTRSTRTTFSPRTR
jgi:hypothetical protein